MPKKTLIAAKEANCEVLVQVKGNQPSLLKACENIVQHKSPLSKDRTASRGHGRQEVRITKVFSAKQLPQDWLDCGVECVIQVERQRGVLDTKINQIVFNNEKSYYISTTNLTARTLAKRIREHWSIENKNHYVRDTAMHEDASRIRKCPQIMLRLRSFALNILRANKIKNIKAELYRNALSLKNVLNYKGLTQG